MITRKGPLRNISSTSLSGKEGFFIDAAGAVLASATAVPYALVISADDPAGENTVMLLPGDGSQVEAKCHSTVGSVAKGDQLVLHSNGTVKKDTGTGARVVVARAEEAAVDSQLLKVTLIQPQSYAS